MAPTSPTDADQLDTRLSTLIDEARSAGDRTSYRQRRARARVDREFSHIADAIDRGLRTVDPSSADAAILERLRDAVRNR